MVIMHAEHIRSFYYTWMQAKAAGIKLPETEDPDYASLETLLVHILRSAGGYMRWICKNLGLNDPEIKIVPLPEAVQNEAESYIAHLLERWNLPLVQVDEERILNEVYKSNWGVDYCIEAMLEHAVMHPLRHEFQLKELLASSLIRLPFS